MINYISNFQKCISWIYKNSLDNNKGITVTSLERKIYPEVTGYYIPTLLQWGERELAISYAKYLCSIQKVDGSWYDSDDVAPYVFDSAQILKGLLSIRNILPEVENNIIRGCDWILSNMQENGQLITPSKDAWGQDENFCSELIHIYCLSPLREAGEVFARKDYLEKVDRILSFYLSNKMEKIENFSLLSHFYAYVMEGLFDLGEVELCRKSMERLEKYRNKKGAVTGLKDVPWVCSTGLFQLALVWYKLDELEKGNSLFYYALKLQNASGGWYGSYPSDSLFSRFYRGRNKPFYFENAEISWACKYFLDALALKEKLEFEKQAPSFMEEIDSNDGRLELICNIICSLNSNKLKICDVGCGKGRYVKKLSEVYSSHEYYASDISETVMKNMDCVKDKKTGLMTNIPYGDEEFDIVYVCEAYEHAIHLEMAFWELYRITKKGGKIIIIDKPIEKKGQLEIYEWEQWIDDDNMKKIASNCDAKLEIINSVPYEDKNDGLFRAWIISK